jgi:hypothetical protein
MKGLYFVVALLAVASAEDFCSNDAIAGCKGQSDSLQEDGSDIDELISCNANYSGFSQNVQFLQAYANDHLQKSFDYLLLSANFGTHVKNRPGFEKQFRALSDTAWNHAISLIKHITKRGGAHDFGSKPSSAFDSQKRRTLELDELNALALALDTEKTLAAEAHSLHERYSHANHKAHYDPEVAHYLEEKFIESQADTVRKLSGYTNDLKHLIQNVPDTSLSVYLFDEYLQKQ